MNMIISSDLEMCKAKFEELIGKRIVCKTNGGRTRIRSEEHTSELQSRI